MLKKWLDILSKSLLFKGISKESLDIMIECLKPTIRKYKKNDIVTIAGEDFEGVGIVLSGNLTVTKENAAGDRVIMNFMSSGDIFGEIAAYSEKGKWPATIIAQEESIVAYLPSHKIMNSCDNLCLSHKMLTLNMLKIISDKALGLNKKVEYMAIKSLRGKICTFLLDQYNKSGNTSFMLPMKRNELADFLNVSRPSLSREMCKMRDEGLIDFHKASIKINDVSSLENIVLQ